MKTRLDLHKELMDIVGHGRVFFQPPENLQIKYPAVIYELSDIDAKYADDIWYKKDKKYNVTYVTKDPDDPIIDAICEMRNCSFDRSFRTSGLNHYVYTIYY